jgi:hypothetical protein
MTKLQAEREFKMGYLPYLPKGDKPAKRMAWNNFVDQLQREGRITAKQASTWDQPEFIKA